MSQSDAVSTTGGAPTPTTSVWGIEEYKNNLHKRLESAIALKDYALNRNLGVTDDVIAKLDGAASWLKDGTITEHENDIDTAIRGLTEVTYPTTVETIDCAAARSNVARTFLNWLMLIAIITLVFAIAAHALTFSGRKDETDASAKKGEPAKAATKGQPQTTEASPISLSPTMKLLLKSFLALCLGMLGASVYIFFNTIGVMTEKAFSNEDRASLRVRIVLGAIMGWVFFFACCHRAFDTDPATSTDRQESLIRTQDLLLLVPFLAGFSTRLVVGLINQVIRAIELTLNLEDKATVLRRRQAKGTSASTNVSAPTG